ncbi:hypothetical protein OG810_33595 [Streptomyces sp. NBC_01693]|uniref:hypothetical protein n=1 Tax=Streptomyces TaxID=1883 RepID=UPI00192245C8|nr:MULTISPECIES: hypothetical protein [Streptomyces]MBL1286942.1 hypothetical protein [Streptomyces silvae]
MVEHYRDRASIGLIITEGIHLNHEAQAFVGRPAIVTDKQVAGRCAWHPPSTERRRNDCTF